MDDSTLGRALWICDYFPRPHAEVLGNMSGCDIFSLASWGEASGTVYGDAMQFGKPVVACAGEGISEVLRDRDHGRRVPAQDVAALAGGLRWLLADEARRLKIGEQARALANRELSCPHAARTLIDTYRRLVHAAHGESSLEFGHELQRLGVSACTVSSSVPTHDN